MNKLKFIFACILSGAVLTGYAVISARSAESRAQEETALLEKTVSNEHLPETATLPGETPAEAETEVTAVAGKEKIDKQRCSYKGIPLKGKVQVVTSFADFDIQIVSSFPDIKVKQVTSFPNNCGEWQFVESFPDFKIRYVTSFPDVKVQFVDSFPGIP